MSDRVIMTKDEAEQYHWLVREITLCQQRIKALDAEAEQWSDTPEVVAALSENRTVIEAHIKKCEEHCERFEAWLAAVSDPQLQSWLYARCVEGMSWVQIAAEANMKSDTIRTAIYRFFAREAA